MKRDSFLNWAFYILVALITFLLYQRDIGDYGVNKFVFLFIVVVYALLADYKRLMMLTAFLLPLANGLPGNYIFPILCVLILWKGMKKIQASSLVWVAFILIMMSEFIHVLFFAPSIDAPNFIGYGAAIFLLLVVGGSDCEGSDNTKNALAFCLGSVIMLTIIMMNFSLITGDEIMEMNVRIGETRTYTDNVGLSLGTNPNNIGLYSIAALSISFVLWRYKKIPAWLLAVFAILSFLAGVASFSRTWMVSLVLLGLAFLFLNRGGQKRKGDSFISFLVMVAGVIGIYLYFTRYGSAFNIFSDRFSESQVETAGDRTTLFVEYHNWMFSHWWALIVGVGSCTYKEVMQIFNSTHNSLQQIFIAYGIPGLIFFLALLYKSIKKWRVPNERMVYLPILVIAFFLQSSQFLNPHYCMYPFIASFFILKMVKHDSLIDDAQKVKSKKTIM